VGSKLKSYNELSQEDRDLVNSAINQMKQSATRTQEVRKENEINRDAMLKKDRDFSETPGDRAEYIKEPSSPENSGKFEHPILRRRKKL
jgi:hypothetical protein